MSELKNTRHERFCLALFEGCTQTEAYRRAGYKNGSNIRKLASALAKQPAVTVRLDELKRLKTADTIASIDERKSVLTEIYRSEPQGGRDAVTKQGHRIAAIAEHNRMEGVGSEGADVSVFVPIQFVQAERRDYQDED